MLVKIKEYTMEHQLISNYANDIWVLMIDGAGKEIHFKSEDINTVGCLCRKYINDNYIYSKQPNWRCTSLKNFKKYKWTYGSLDGIWYRAADFTKNISLKSDKKFKQKKDKN